MSKSLESIKEKLRLAGKQMEPCRILELGEYGFSIQDVSQEYDQKRHYDYIFVKMFCNDNIRTTDRFPLIDKMMWKLKALLVSVGLPEDDWPGERQLVGLTGRLVAEKLGELTPYRYQLA
jgi:hypothetical protein